jgi:polysaccharide export outer membrane protein
MGVRFEHNVAAFLLLLLSTFAFAPGAMGQEQEESEWENPQSDRFRIGVQDQLRVVVWGQPELSLSLTVRPDGKITLPLIHDVDVEGRTPEEVRLTITERLENFIRDPNVTVIVEAINSFRIFFVGEVNTKGVLQLFRPTRILQAIAMAGGPTEFSKNEITLVREEYGIEKRIPIDYKKLLAGDPRQENIYLKPGDTLIFK